MQPQITTLLAMAEGTSIVNRRCMDNRFNMWMNYAVWVRNISVDGKVAVIEGWGIARSSCKATDLRAGAAMVIAALSAKGTTEIENIHHIERGYGDIVEKLQHLGADIKKVIIPDGAELKQAL